MTGEACFQEEKRGKKAFWDVFIITHCKFFFLLLDNLNGKLVKVNLPIYTGLVK